VTAGVSKRRIVWPLVLSGLLVSVLIVAIREVAAPALGRRQLTVSRMLTKGKPDRIPKVGHLRDPGGARVSMDAYMPIGRRMEGPILTIRAPDGGAKEMRSYPTLDWSEGTDRWIATRGGVAFALGEGVRGSRREIPVGEAAPLEADAVLVEVTVTDRATLGLSMEESAALLAADPDNSRLVTSHHEQLTLPLSALVLLVLALPFAFRLDTKGAMPGLLGALAVGAVYYAASTMVRGLGGGADLNPVVVAWAPTVVFLSLGTALVLGMDR
jgi:lipopolysaccharide export LptBFGC system permease protein LptF